MQTKFHLMLKKTKLVIFKSKRKQLDGDIKLTLSCERLFSMTVVNTLGLKLIEISHGNLI